MGKSFEDSLNQAAKDGKALQAALLEAQKQQPAQTSIGVDDLIRAKGPDLLRKIPGGVVPPGITPQQIVAKVKSDGLLSTVVDGEFAKLERRNPDNHTGDGRIVVSEAVANNLAQLEARFPEQMANLRKNAKVELADEKTKPLEALDKLRAALRTERAEATPTGASPSPAMVR